MVLRTRDASRPKWWRGTEKSDSKLINPLFSRPGETEELPRWWLPEDEMEGETAYHIVLDETMLDGSARQNMATFDTTWMDEWADKIYAASYDKNMIDKNEYPQTAAIEQRCIHMIADLWNSPSPRTTMGASAIGSSEACMLGGLALKKRWQLNVKLKTSQSINPILCSQARYKSCGKSSQTTGMSSRAISPSPRKTPIWTLTLSRITLMKTPLV